MVKFNVKATGVTVETRDRMRRAWSKTENRTRFDWIIPGHNATLAVERLVGMILAAKIEDVEIDSVTLLENE